MGTAEKPSVDTGMVLGTVLPVPVAHIVTSTCSHAWKAAQRKVLYATDLAINIAARNRDTFVLVRLSMRVTNTASMKTVVMYPFDIILAQPSQHILGAKNLLRRSADLLCNGLLRLKATETPAGGTKTEKSSLPVLHAFTGKSFLVIRWMANELFAVRRPLTYIPVELTTDVWREKKHNIKVDELISNGNGKTASCTCTAMK